jgi:hypothetical protein
MRNVEELERALDYRRGKGRGPASAQSPLPHNVPKPNRDDETKAALPVCDWVYFATPSKAGWENTRAIVSDFKMIIRPVYEKMSEGRDRPKPIPNVKHIRQGQTILLVYGGKGEPYRPMLSCKVVASPRPVPGFEAFSFAEVSQAARLQTSGYGIDPYFRKFTGISVEEVSPVTGSIQTPPKRGTAIRTWEQVFGGTTPDED